MSLLKKVKKFPLSPGVYLFLDKQGHVLYVGRSISLKKRISNYFRPDIDPRIKKMVDSSDDIKFIKTTSILEAIILEANLIKKHWPDYNIQQKDNRSFLYVVIPKTDYPKPFIIRQRELIPSNAKVFGPYQSLTLLKNALRIIRRIFPYSTCKIGKPCFNYQIGLCPGLCVGKISKEDYQKNINNIILLLSGQKKRLIKDYPALKHIQDVSLIQKEEIGNSFENMRIEGYDISHLSGKETFGSMVVFEEGRPEKKEYRLFKIKKAPQSDDLRALEEVITRRLRHLEWPMPSLMLIDGGKPQIDFISRQNINVPIVGISKYSEDKLIFQKNTKDSLKQLITSIKPTLLKVREEAHRFSRKSSKRNRRI